jgi:hypothetical protein
MPLEQLQLLEVYLIKIKYASDIRSLMRLEKRFESLVTKTSYDWASSQKQIKARLGKLYS